MEDDIMLYNFLLKVQPISFKSSKCLNTVTHQMILLIDHPIFCLPFFSNHSPYLSLLCQYKDSLILYYFSFFAIQLWILDNQKHSDRLRYSYQN